MTAALTIAGLAVLAAAALIVAGVAGLAAWACQDLAVVRADERDDARHVARALRAERDALRAELHALRRAVTDAPGPDDLPDGWWSTAADIASLPEMGETL